MGMDPLGGGNVQAHERRIVEHGLEERAAQPDSGDRDDERHSQVQADVGLGA